MERDTDTMLINSLVLFRNIISSRNNGNSCRHHEHVVKRYIEILNERGEEYPAELIETTARELKIVQ